MKQLKFILVAISILLPFASCNYFSGYDSYAAFYEVSYSSEFHHLGDTPDKHYGETGSEVATAQNTGNLVRFGYDFVGWGVSKDASKIITPGEKISIETSHVILYAQWQEKATYQIGDYGPAGGLIFYIDNDDYYESAPVSHERIRTWSNGVSYSNELSYNVKNTGAFDDWVLPTRQLLQEMYNNLHNKNLGNFSNSNYWSSDDDGDNAWVLYFGSGSELEQGKTLNYFVRPYRVFQ